MDRISVCEILIHVKLEFVIFSIHEMIWRVFFLRPNYRHNSNMINVDCICIFKIRDYVRLKFAVLTVLELIWRHFCLQPNYQHDSGMVNVVLFLIFKILVCVKFGLINLTFLIFLNWFGAFSIFDQIIDTILI